MFSIFPQLPTELRLMIWRAAGPKDLAPALFIHDLGHGNVYHPPNTVKAEDRTMFWSNNPPPHRLISASLLLVSHEARRILLDWKQRQEDYDIRPHGTSNNPQYRIAYNTCHDTVYIPTNSLESVIYWHNLTERGSDMQPTCSPVTWVTRIAVSWAIFQDDKALERLRYILAVASKCIYDLVFMIDPVDDLLQEDSGISDKPWGYKQARQGVYVRQPGLAQHWHIIPGREPMDEDCRRLIMGCLDEGSGRGWVWTHVSLTISMIKAYQR